MQANSRPVTSNQSGIHPELANTVNKYRRTAWRKPHAQHNLHAFARLREWLSGGEQPLILDSFCGTGMSTRILAETFPTCRIVGIDRSTHRLQRHTTVPDSDDYLLLQAECEPLWQLMAANGVRVARHYLLYPNPWPKAQHLQRRIHGHPGVVPLYLLGGALELRSNWQLYVEEFGLAMHLLGCRGSIARVQVDQPLTLFEEKYAGSGHALWRFEGQVP